MPSMGCQGTNRKGTLVPIKDSLTVKYYLNILFFMHFKYEDLHGEHSTLDIDTLSILKGQVDMLPDNIGLIMTKDGRLLETQIDF